MLESYLEIVPFQWKRLIWDISNDNAPPGTRINPLQTTWFEQGIVSSRVALLLRSAEIKPLFVGFVLCFAHLSCRGRKRNLSSSDRKSSIGTC